MRYCFHNTLCYNFYLLYFQFTYEGLPYLSKAEENIIKQQLKDKTLLDNLMTSMELADEKKLQEYCSEVSK